MSHSNSDASDLFLVYMNGAENTDMLAICDEAIQLDESLCLVKTSESQSKLYHRIKRYTQPASLFVGRLKETPKFKGMAEGAVKWTRARADG